MSHDLEQQPVPMPTPVEAPMPPATNFAFGPPAGSGPRVNNRLVAIVAAVAVLGAGAFVGMKVLGGPDSAPETPVVVKKKPAPVTLTSDRNVVLSVLKNVATAEESYAIDAGRYTTKMPDLVDQGLAPDARVKVTLISADAKRYCFSAAGAGKLIAYYDSRTGKPSSTACR